MKNPGSGMHTFHRNPNLS